MIIQKELGGSRETERPMKGAARLLKEKRIEKKGKKGLRKKEKGIKKKKDNGACPLTGR